MTSWTRDDDVVILYSVQPKMLLHIALLGDYDVMMCHYVLRVSFCCTLMHAYVDIIFQLHWNMQQKFAGLNL